MDTSELIHELRLQLWDHSYAHYLGSELFSWQWWSLVALLVAAYAVWWRLVAKGKLVEILLFGSFVSVAAALVDVWGVTTGHWQYNIRLFPLLPVPFPFDYTVAPILLMLAYQYGKSWAAYLGWSALASAFSGFLVTPAFQAASIMNYYNWSPAYYFVPVLAIAIIARAAMLLVLRVVKAARPQATKPARDFSPLPWPAIKPLPDDDDDGQPE